MTANDICCKAIEIAASKTMYVKKCAGAKLTATNKARFTSIDHFNAKRTAQIFAADEDTAGYDEFGLFKALTGINCFDFSVIIGSCGKLSTNFNDIQAGELVFMPDRFGVYIGNKKVVTVSPAGVGMTILDGWKSHGKLAGVDYTEDINNEETDVEVRNSGSGDRNRVHELPQKAERHECSNGRRRSEYLPILREGNGTDKTEPTE